MHLVLLCKLFRYLYIFLFVLYIVMFIGKPVRLMVWFIVFNTTFKPISVISWQPVLMMEETGVPRENHWPVTNHWQTLSHNVVSSTPHHEQSLNSLHSWSNWIKHMHVPKLKFWKSSWEGFIQKHFKNDLHWSVICIR